MLIWLALLVMAAGVIGYGVFIFFVMISLWTGAPYVPSSGDRTRLMMELAEIRPGERAVDLGSGDGRLLRAAARAGAHVVGWEMNPVLALWSRLVARFHGAGERIIVYRGSLWRAPISEFDVIFLYLLPASMKKIAPKILREARPGARVIVNAFPIHEWPLDSQHGHVYRYRVPLCPTSGPPSSTLRS